MADLPEAHESVRFTFDNLIAAVEGLLTVVEDARSTDKVYSFSGLTPGKILKTGLTLQGEVADISERMALIPGAHSA